MKSAAIYARCSTANKDQKPELQIEELRRYCTARGIQISEEIVDHGYSGGTDQRPGLKRLMQLVRTRKIEGVLVLKLDRLFRSIKHLVLTLDEFSELGVTFVSVTEGLDYSVSSGRFFAQILGVLAEFERQLIVERTKLGLEHARRCGKKLGRPRRRDDNAIQKLHEQGKTYREIAKQLGVSRAAVYRALRLGTKSS